MEAPATTWPRFLLALAGGALLGMLSFAALLLGLQKTGNLPPPPVANVICVDEKLVFLRERMPAAPNLLVVGSSVAWRHFDGEVAAKKYRPLNGAFCYLEANQTTVAAEWLVSRLPTVNHVVMIAGPQDFEACAGVAPAFDIEDADRFVFERATKWHYYVRYFDPVSLARNASRIAEQRAPSDPLEGAGALVFTRYGDGPIETEKSLELLYGPISNLDDACFASLRKFALSMRRAGKDLLFVSAPLHPGWKTTYDPSGRLRAEFDSKLRAALAETGARHWDGDGQAGIEAGAFFDGIHLRWSAVRRFTEQIMRVLPANGVSQ